MGSKIIRLPQIANPTIEQVFAEFLAEHRKRMKSQTQKKYEDVIELLQLHLNSYAYESLSEAESALFDKYFSAEGKDHREFCQLFGPEKIIENLGSFLGFLYCYRTCCTLFEKELLGYDIEKSITYRFDEVFTLFGSSTVSWDSS